MSKINWIRAARKRHGQPWPNLGVRGPEPFQRAMRQRLHEIAVSEDQALSPGELLITLALRGDVRLRQLYVQFKKEASKSTKLRS